MRANSVRCTTLAGVKVLFVGRNEDLRLIYRSFLSVEGADVDTVANVVEAVEAVRQGSYDVVLFGQENSECVERKTLSQLRNGGESCPATILITTARDGRTENDVGFSEILNLPVRREALVDTVERWAYSRSSEVDEDSDRGTADLLKSLKRSFLERLPEVLQEVEQAYREKNWDKLARVCHKTRGSTEIFQLDSLSDELRELERMLLTHRNERAVEMRVASIVKRAKELYESRG